MPSLIETVQGSSLTMAGRWKQRSCRGTRRGTWRWRSQLCWQMTAACRAPTLQRSAAPASSCSWKQRSWWRASGRRRRRCRALGTPRCRATPGSEVPEAPQTLLVHVCICTACCWGDPAGDVRSAVAGWAAFSYDHHAASWPWYHRRHALLLGQNRLYSPGLTDAPAHPPSRSSSTHIV
jgi:hypothetical protein